MSSLCKRLREAAEDSSDEMVWPITDLLREAAAEIERLEQFVTTFYAELQAEREKVERLERIVEIEHANFEWTCQCCGAKLPSTQEHCPCDGQRGGGRFVATVRHVSNVTTHPPRLPGRGSDGKPRERTSRLQR